MRYSNAFVIPSQNTHANERKHTNRGRTNDHHIALIERFGKRKILIPEIGTNETSYDKKGHCRTLNCNEAWQTEIGKVLIDDSLTISLISNWPLYSMQNHMGSPFIVLLRRSHPYLNLSDINKAKSQFPSYIVDPVRAIENKMAEKRQNIKLFIGSKNSTFF